MHRKSTTRLTRVFSYLESANSMNILFQSHSSNKTQLSNQSCLSKCPKFNKCNAPVCPLDKEWQKRKHISGDKCCVYLLELSKANAEGNFVGAGLSNVYEAIEVVKQDILYSSASIKRAYTRAASAPSRLKPKFIKANKS